MGRFFLMRDREGKIGMMYVSEKNDGEMTLACALGVLGMKVTVDDTQPPVELDPLTPRTQFWAKQSLQTYDVAFNFEKKLRKEIEVYANLIPSTLYPFLIIWRDSSEVEHQLVLAAQDQEIKQMWVNYIRDEVQRILASPPGDPSAPRTPG